MAGLARGTGYAAQVVPALASGGTSEAPVAVAGLRGLATRYGRNAITGGAVAALNGASQPGTVTDRLHSAQAAIPAGMVLGAGVPAAFDAAVAGARNIAPAAGAAGPAARLTAEQIPLTPGQRLGGFPKRAEDVATSVPILGDAINGARGRGVDALNRAVANRALAPVGETAPANVTVGNDLTAHVADRLSAAYKKAESLVTQAKPDDAFTQALQDRAKSLTDLPADSQEQFLRTVKNQVLDPLINGSASGAQIGDIISNLKTAASDYKQQGGPNAALGRAFDGVADDVTGLADRQNPGYAEARAAADEGWANYVRMRQAGQMQGAKGGVFTPAQLKMAVRSQDDSVGNGASAKGDALLYRLADDAEQTMGANYPDSGTAGRQTALTLMGLGAVPTHGATLAPLVAPAVASLPYAMMGRGAANAFEAADPATTQALSQAVQRVGAKSPNAMLPSSITSLTPTLIYSQAQSQPTQ